MQKKQNKSKTFMKIPSGYITSGKFRKFTEEHPEVYHEFLYRNIKRAIENDKDKCILFQVANLPNPLSGPAIACVTKSKYDLILNECMSIFVEYEMYEMAQEVKNFIQKQITDSAIETLIQESNEYEL